MNLHYLNADFDISLRKNPSRLSAPAIRKTVQAMTFHGLFAAGEGDMVLVHGRIAGGYDGYLEESGILMPHAVQTAEIDRSLKLVPFGWNAETIALNEGQDHPSAHPSYEIVRRVNSRVFSAALEEEITGAPSEGAVCRSTGEVEQWLSVRVSRRKGWVVKADHANSGLGNRRVRAGALTAGDRRFVDSVFAEDSAAVIEPWHDRTADLSAVFNLSSQGEIEDFRTHETVCTRDGALIGVLFTTEPTPWDGPLAGAAGKVAGALAREGYFGPVCFDAFVFSDAEGTHLRSLVDLNCRRAVSDGAHRLWRERFGDRAMYWRFFNANKLRPGAVAGVRRSELAFSPGNRRGALFTAPWKVERDGMSVAMPKLGVAFIGKSPEEVRAMAGVFRRKWEK